ncbi:acyl-CoA synthetase [Lysobacter sp. K5869]|uniref:class I adenylate-forming enzyme family protein n=1 Tax=Lysobacter sp. K5869 TaxID=2820808 RepID=UPI001C0632E7|nr:AMP-binding protein [Lysobacter sp. K5869]QWP77901.1 acyl-CoA synthetase [Lysobacter sp. K5869]
MSAVIDPSQGVQASQRICELAPPQRELLAGAAQRALVFGPDGRVARERFEREVRALAARLPQGRYAVNLCENRYRFLVALCAVAVRGQINLLPPSRAPAIVDDVLGRYPDSYCIGDLALDPLPPRYLRLDAQLEQLDGEPLRVDDEALLAIGFTSGSTGQPKPNLKTWGAFRTSTAQNLAALGGLLREDGATELVATVPPQHMYGMEMSVLLPLLGPLSVHAQRPFFPGDVARALADAATPPLLVTTPVHLRALVESQIELPALAGIVSATAPLPRELAQTAEERYGCEVREVFGSTETCVFARRRTAREQAWTPLPGVRVCPQPDGTAIHAPHLPDAVVLADLMEVEPDGRFHVRGRAADLLEIAGKRASLGDLTRKLLAIDGVDDGAVFQLDDADAFGVRRIAALAVAPSLSEAQILAALRRSVDPVFLPRPLKRVAALPRNETGKLPRHALEALLRAQA